MNKNVDKALDELAKSLDISDSLYDLAEQRYKSISKWLTRVESTVKEYSPEIYPQGSFNLGTVVRPINGKSDYDIDLVCVVDLSKSHATQNDLKQAIGKEIKSYFKANNFNNPPNEGRRCWTLTYSENANFHLDVLPAIPDAKLYKAILESRGIKNEWSDYAIAITDNQHLNYKTINTEWPGSNPKGYAKWFYGKMQQRINEQRKILAKSIEELPDHKIKTPLQRAIQILKLHRDTMFINDQDDKPISIIITTLAAHSYNGETSLSETLFNLVRRMPDYIDDIDGKSKILNPVNPLENFADKWEHYPQRKENFLQWLSKIEDEIPQWIEQPTREKLANQLSERFHTTTIEKALSVKVSNQTNLPAIASSNALTLTPTHRKLAPWKMDLKFKAILSVQFERAGFKSYMLRNNDYEVEQRGTLRFNLKTNAPGVYKYFWQVVNTGEAAYNANSLRGGFYDGELRRGGKSREEGTLYTGKHCVEGFVVHNGTCIARTGDFIINIK